MSYVESVTKSGFGRLNSMVVFAVNGFGKTDSIFGVNNL